MGDHSEAARHRAVALDGKVLATGGLNHTVRFWDWERGSASREWRAQSSVVIVLAWLSDTHLLSAGASSGDFT